MCEVYNPTFNPDAIKMLDRVAAVDPFPLVPITCMFLIIFWMITYIK